MPQGGPENGAAIVALSVERQASYPSSILSVAADKQATTIDSAIASSDVCVLSVHQSPLQDALKSHTVLRAMMPRSNGQLSVQTSTRPFFARGPNRGTF